MASSAPIGVAALALLAGLAGLGCAMPNEPEDTSSEDSIYGGAVDSDGPVNGAVVALRIGDGTKAELCSATVIAPNVLLTARHCVSESLTRVVVCNSNGDSENGPHFADDFPVDQIHVFTGSKPNFAGPVAAAVTKVFRPEGQVVCNRDIALLVLDRPLEDVTPLPVRLTRPVGVEETIRSVGYGKTDTGSTGTRLRKAGVVVRAVGPGLSKSDTALGDHEFEVGVSICHGDSGGPAISQTTGAVVGVVSRGGDCGEDFGHIYVETSGFSDLIAQAIEAAGAPPAADEPPPAPPPPAASADGKGCSASPAAMSLSGRAWGEHAPAPLLGLLGAALVAFGRRLRRRARRDRSAAARASSRLGA
jgi:hypothetical protein